MASPGRLQLAFGRVLRKQRIDRGYSQESFADLVGVHRTYVGSVERGERNISIENIERFARALGLRVSALFILVEHESEVRRGTR